MKSVMRLNDLLAAGSDDAPDGRLALFALVQVVPKLLEVVEEDCKTVVLEEHISELSVELLRMEIPFVIHFTGHSLYNPTPLHELTIRI